MAEHTVVFIHGFASSANSTKARFFREKANSAVDIDLHVIDLNPKPVDFEYMTVTGLINRVRQYVIDRGIQDITIAASSLGALVGLNYAHRYGSVRKLFLLAPVLFYGSVNLGEDVLSRWKDTGSAEVHHYGFNETIPLRDDFHRDALNYSGLVAPPAPVMIVHGKNDDVVAIEYSRHYAASHSDEITLIELESDHSLNDRLDAIWEQMLSFLSA